MTDAFHIRYVAHSRVPEYEALGWRVAGTGRGMGGHAIYSTLMRFDGEDTPPEPASPVPSLPQHSGECAVPT